MATVAMTNDQRKQLVKILAESQVVSAISRRQSLLEDAGLDFFAPRLNFDVDPRTFAQQLVRELQDYGTYQGQPALVYLLRYLRDEVLHGHEAESAFLDSLLTPYSTGTRTGSTISQPIINEPVFEMPPPSPGTLRLLMMTSNPTDTGRLRLDREYKVVRTELDAAPARFSYVLEPGVSVSDLSRWLLQYRPQIVHFAGHGDLVKSPNGAAPSGIRGAMLDASEAEARPHEVLPSGIVLEDESGKKKLVPPEVLVSLLGLSFVRSELKVVLLNSCWGEGQAQAIVQQAGIPIAIGMNRPIGDEAAIRFAQGFYRGIGYGAPVQDAFEVGRSQMILLDTGFKDVPVLFTAAGIDPKSFKL